MPGVLAITASNYQNEKVTVDEMEGFNKLSNSTKEYLNAFPLVVICDDSDFVAKTLNNFLWVTFTRSNPANDIHGIDSFTENKHWGCKSSLLIDARSKPHHAPPLVKDSKVEAFVDSLAAKGKSLNGIY